MTLYKWSTTPASNATIDDTINARENQAPSTVNDAMRAIMAAVAKWRDDLSGNLVTGGSSTAYTLTTSQGFTSLIDGLHVRARLNATSGSSPTLNVDSLGAKALQFVSGTAPASGVLLLGAIYGFTYDSSADAWIVDGAPAVVEPTGSIRAYVGTTAPSGYVRANGRTIGNAASSASERANADTSALYSLLWDSYSDTICPVSSGRGANAAADYAANKTITLPDLRGRALFGLDDMGGSAAGRLAGATIDQTTNGASGGADTVTLVEGNLPAHTHGGGTLAADAGGAHRHFMLNTGNVTNPSTVSDTNFVVRQASFPSTPDFAYGLGGNSTEPTVGLTSSSETHTHAITGSTGSTGSGTAIDKLPPAFLTTWLIKL